MGNVTGNQQEDMIQSERS